MHLKIDQHHINNHYQYQYAILHYDQLLLLESWLKTTSVRRPTLLIGPLVSDQVIEISVEMNLTLTRPPRQEDHFAFVPMVVLSCYRGSTVYTICRGNFMAFLLPQMKML
jgi:hypothetical protein